MDDVDLLRLERAARAATSQAFLTGHGGVRYGAAALALSGKIFSSGQYSSFNHVTNVHAEQAVLVMAAVAGEADVVGLAVASTDEGRVASPCGVCRQVMLEHATRTGRDFKVVLVGNGCASTCMRVSELLPHAWTSHRQGSGAGGLPTRTFSIRGKGKKNAQTTLRAGDYVHVPGQGISIVWDAAHEPGVALGKLKYSHKGINRWTKEPHAFTDPFAYDARLLEHDWGGLARCGAYVASLQKTKIDRVFASLPAEQAGINFPSALQRIIESCHAGAAVFVGGSRSMGVATARSDWDLIIRLPFDQARIFKARCAECLLHGELAPPDQSKTWHLFDKMWPGGCLALIRDGRFADTFVAEGRTFSLLYDSALPPETWLGKTSKCQGHIRLQGRVEQAEEALFKRSRYTLACEDGRLIEVSAYYKSANLIREGDHLAVGGWLVKEGGIEKLTQLSPARDPIVWLRRSNRGNSWK
jgi:cytidine deaminase